MTTTTTATVPMTPMAYLICISQTEVAPELHQLHSEIVTDMTLAHHDRSDLEKAVRRRFCQLNSKAGKPQKSRW